MRCRKHPSDYSSSVGVCASCLRHRLFSVIAAQQQQQPPGGADDDHTVVFPRSVSPYVAPRRNSLLLQQQQEAAFYCNRSAHSTPEKSTKKKIPKKNLLSRIILFRSRSEKSPGDPPRVSSSSSSSSWFHSFFKGTPELPSCGPSRVLAHRATSSVRDDDYASDAYKMTPFTRRHHARSSSSNSAISSFCLSPLVWATPLHRHNNSSSDAAVDLRPSSRIHLSSASTFCANRSRKLANFGRCTPNR